MITRPIDGLTVHGTPLAIHPHGFLLGAELLAIAAPALAKLEPAIGGLGIDLAAPDALQHLALAVLGKLQLDVIVSALGESLAGLGADRARAQRVTAQLFRCLVAEIPGPDGRLAMTDLSTDSAVNLAVGRSFGRYLKLLRFALEVNFAGPFGGGSSAASPAADGATSPTG